MDKKKYGIFYTPNFIIDIILSRIDLTKNLEILEPGCGDGRFIKSMYKKNNNINISAADIQKKEITCLKKKYPEADLKNKSFLSNVFNNKLFDLIIGNPPYAAKITEKEKIYCREITKTLGKIKLESSVFFLIKSISLLKENGQLAFILPSSILRVESYFQVRNFIKKNTIIEEYETGYKYDNKVIKHAKVIVSKG